MNEQLMADILERIRGRFYGKYRGTVVDIDTGTLRLKANVPSVLGEQSSGWCMPCVPYAGDQFGLAFLPEIGAGVWIEFEGGDVSYPVWTGCYWRAGEIPSDLTPTARGIVTKAGLKIILDDNAGTITVSDAHGNSVKLDSSGVTLSRGSSTVAVGDSSVSVNNGALEVT